MTTRGRKAATAPEAPTDVLDRDNLRADSAALTEIGRRSAEVALHYGDGQAYDRTRIVSETRFFMGQSAEAMLEAGKRLLLLKENEEHGSFIDIVENNLHLSRRTAQVMMQASVKYMAPALASNAQAPALLGLGKAKLLELLAEPDEALEQLLDGGTVADLKLDDIAAMSSRELRDALKKERAERTKSDKAKQKVIDGKSAKLDALEEQLAHRESAEPSELERYQLDSVRDAATEAEMALRHLVGQAANVLGKPATELAATCARQAVEFVAQVLAGLIHENAVPVNFEEMVSPHWLPKPGAASKTAANNKR